MFMLCFSYMQPLTPPIVAPDLSLHPHLSSLYPYSNGTEEHASYYLYFELFHQTWSCFLSSDYNMVNACSKFICMSVLLLSFSLLLS